jgi:cobalt/nickel transport system permease protein
MLASLAHRALDRAERVHRAMTARGFDGEIRVLARPRWRAVDTALLAGVAVFCAAVRFLPVVEWLGGLVGG